MGIRDALEETIMLCAVITLRSQAKEVVYLFCGTEEICLGLRRTRIKHLLSEHVM